MSDPQRFRLLQGEEEVGELVLRGQPRPARAESEVPDSLLWYRDVTKWLVSLAAAAILVGVGFTEDRAFPWWEGLATMATALVFGVAIVRGILCHVSLADWVNSNEELQRSKDGLTQRSVDEIEESMRRAANRIPGHYQGLLYFFMAGALALLLLLALHVVAPWLAQRSDLGTSAQISTDELVERLLQARTDAQRRLAELEAATR